MGAYSMQKNTTNWRCMRMTDRIVKFLSHDFESKDMTELQYEIILMIGDINKLRWQLESMIDVAREGCWGIQGVPFEDKFSSEFSDAREAVESTSHYGNIPEQRIFAARWGKCLYHICTSTKTICTGYF